MQEEGRARRSRSAENVYKNELRERKRKKSTKIPKLLTGWRRQRQVVISCTNPFRFAALCVESFLGFMLRQVRKENVNCGRFPGCDGGGAPERELFSSAAVFQHVRTVLGMVTILDFSILFFYVMSDAVLRINRDIWCVGW